MNDYASMFSMPPWSAVGLSVVQTIVLYLLVLAALKLAGRRMFAELGAQDLVVLLLVADASNQGLTHTDAGFWGSFFSVIAVIGLGSVIEHIPVLRKLVEGEAVTLYRDGRLNRKLMDKFMVDVSDLNEAARQYGLPSYDGFSTIVLEADGTLTGSVRAAAARRVH